MSDFEFEENNNEFYGKTQNLLGQANPNSAVGALLRSGIVKNEKQANIVLLGLVVVIIFATVWIYRATTGGGRELYYVDDNGRKYDVEEYIELVKQGRDPLRTSKNAGDGGSISNGQRE
jgi:hypothetical protein